MDQLNWETLSVSLYSTAILILIFDETVICILTWSTETHHFDHASRILWNFFAHSFVHILCFVQPFHPSKKKGKESEFNIYFNKMRLKLWTANHICFVILFMFRIFKILFPKKIKKIIILIIPKIQMKYRP